MNEFGVSRTVVREAMSRLQAAGLVETHHGIGTFLFALDDMVRHEEKSAESVSADFRFHLQVALASGNRQFVELMNTPEPRIIPRTHLNTAKFAQTSSPGYLEHVDRAASAIAVRVRKG